MLLFLTARTRYGHFATYHTFCRIYHLNIDFYGNIIAQAPYIIYVEVLEVEDLYTSPVPTKIMGSSLRHTKSEENLTGSEQSNISTSDSQQNVAVRQTPIKNISPYSVRNTDVTFNFPDDDPNDCWSQEDDEITQQVNTYLC